MVTIAGKYVHEKHTNLVEYLVATGIPEELAKKADASKPEVVIDVDGKKIQLVTTFTPEHVFTSNYVDGEEVDELSGTVKDAKSTAVIKGDVLEVSSKYNDGKVGSKVYKFTDEGFTVTLTKTGAPEATLTFKRS
ncbi:fatty acid-binding protein, liver-like [Aethina tumida]|uniref:fatty acid-binding protein, liver-like n=1 Tax=Aethina tumida TaxID=116153 RepID=UPI00214834EC|nr:fatty acid-binding protein, liver-like [Aethina tumida]